MKYFFTILLLIPLLPFSCAPDGDCNCPASDLHEVTNIRSIYVDGVDPALKDTAVVTGIIITMEFDVADNLAAITPAPASFSFFNSAQACTCISDQVGDEIKSIKITSTTALDDNEPGTEIQHLFGFEFDYSETPGQYPIGLFIGNDGKFFGMNRLQLLSTPEQGSIHQFNVTVTLNTGLAATFETRPVFYERR